MFKVKACRNVRIALQSLPERAYSNSFIVEIGGENNDRVTSLYYSMHGLSSHHTRDYPEGVLDCHSYKQFWIDWANAPDFKVGAGALDSTVLLSDYNRYGYVFNSIGITTENNTGDWEFRRNNGMHCYMSYRISFISILKYKYLQKGCN